jgi:hypothetical protein
MFRRTARGLLLAAGLVALIAVSGGQSQPTPGSAPEPPKFPEFATVTKGAKVSEGLFNLYQKDDTLLAEIQPFQLDKPFLLPIAIAKGGGVGGTTLNFDQQWVVSFRRVGDKVFLVRKNVRYTAKPGSPEAKALDTTYTDSVLAAMPIKTINPFKASVLVDLNQIFFTDFADLGAGYIDQQRTTWHKVKAFKKNVELQVAATVVGANLNRTAPSGGNAVIDRRGATVVIHYGLMEMPDGGYQPRKADDRVGHFTTVLKDFSKDGPDTAFVRYVNRWRLERADGSVWKEGGKLVPPKKKIVYWIENSVPDEYRTAVREGILEWNKAFEKVGFRDAIEVRQQEGEEFDPEDAGYATFRWITSEVPYAIGPSRANPFTGEILDADILFDASMVRTYKGESRLFRDPSGKVFEPASPAQANRRGWTLPPTPLDRLRENLGWNDKDEKFDLDKHRERQLAAVQHGYCQCAAQKTSELGLAVLSLAAAGGLVLKEGEKIPEELLLQAIKETAMHEVGHTLGLRHNFKASTVLKAEQLHDTAITSKQGLVGSVMDYNPANIAPKGTKQGHYFTPTLGAYDYWAIDYAYNPNGSDDDLGKVASKVADPKHIFATDEDLMGTNDPLVNQWDMGADPLQFAKDRAKLAGELIPVVAEKLVDKGEGYQRARAAFATLLSVYGDSAYTATRFVGGSSFHRDHKDDPNARDAFVPTAPAKQREALAFLKESILTDKPFDFPPELLRKLGADRWVHWGNTRTMQATEFPVVDRALGIHQTVLDELLSGGTLSTVQNSARLQKADDKPLQIAEIFRAISDASFADLPGPEGRVATAKSSVIRRNLQREYVARLSGIVLGKPTGSGLFLLFGGGGSVPPDAKSLARMHLKEAAKRIDEGLKAEKDDTAKAHLDEMKEQIEKVLKATVTSEGP